MSQKFNHPGQPSDISRRQFLWNYGGGLGGIALAWMLARDKMLAAAESPAAGSLPISRAVPGLIERKGGLHFPAKAKRVVQFYMSGAASHCDMFDYKPSLISQTGQPFMQGQNIEL